MVLVTDTVPVMAQPTEESEFPPSQPSEELDSQVVMELGMVLATVMEVSELPDYIDQFMS
jgi:hypothetical protein